MRGIGANTVQIFEAMLLGSWLSEKDGRKLGGVSAHIAQKDLLEVGKIVPAFNVAQHHSPWKANAINSVVWGSAQMRPSGLVCQAFALYCGVCATNDDGIGIVDDTVTDGVS